MTAVDLLDAEPTTRVVVTAVGAAARVVSAHPGVVALRDLDGDLRYAMPAPVNALGLVCAPVGDTTVCLVACDGRAHQVVSVDLGTGLPHWSAAPARRAGFADGPQALAVVGDRAIAVGRGGPDGPLVGYDLVGDRPLWRNQVEDNNDGHGPVVFPSGDGRVGVAVTSQGGPYDEDGEYLVTRVGVEVFDLVTGEHERSIPLGLSRPRGPARQGPMAVTGSPGGPGEVLVAVALPGDGSQSRLLHSWWCRDLTVAYAPVRLPLGRDPDQLAVGWVRGELVAAMPPAQGGASCLVVAVDSGATVAELGLPDAPVVDVAFAPDGRLYLAGPSGLYRADPAVAG